jgi:hypothetical protein
MIPPSNRAGSAKSLILVVLVVAAIVFLLWLGFRQRGSSEEIDRTVNADKDSAALNQRRQDSLIELSRVRDSSVQRDSIEEGQASLSSRTLSDSISKLREKIRTLTNPLDSLRRYIQLDTFHTNRHKSDSIWIAALGRQRDTLKIDRNQWKRRAFLLFHENKRLTQDVIRLGEIGKQSCDLLIVHVPCPQLVLGGGGQVTPSGELSVGLQLTGGIPIRLGRGKARTARPVRVPVPETSRTLVPVVSELELSQPWPDSLPVSVRPF